MSAQERIAFTQYVGDLASKLREDVDTLMKVETDEHPLLMMLMEMSKKQRKEIMESDDEIPQIAKFAFDVNDINRLIPIYTSMSKDEKKSNQYLKKVKNIQLFVDIMLRMN